MSARAAASVFTFAFAVVVAFALLALNTWLGDVLAATWAFVVFPAAGLMLQRRRTSSARDEPHTRDYWRTGNWQSGVH